MNVLIRIISHLSVFNNFLKSSLNNAQDIRFLLLNYLATSLTGKDFIKQLFSTFMELNLDLLFFCKNATSKDKILTPMDTSELATNQSSSPTIPSNSITSVLTESETKSKKLETTSNSEEITINSMIVRAHKHLSELIVLMGKTFGNLGVRHRRSMESQVIKDTHVITEELFNGIACLLLNTSQMSGNFR